MSVVGRLVYGNCHHEPLGFNTPLSDHLADLDAPDTTRYFAAQSSSHRIFLRRELPKLFEGWEFAPSGLSLLLPIWDPAGSAAPSFIPSSLSSS